jgi:hypothetical protein
MSKQKRIAHKKQRKRKRKKNNKKKVPFVFALPGVFCSGMHCLLSQNITFMFHRKDAGSFPI